MTTEREQILALAGEPIGYLHKDIARYDFVHKDVKELWRKCSNTTADRCEFYTIPVFTADQVIAARKDLAQEVERLKVEKAEAVEKMHDSANQFVEFVHGDHSKLATERDELRKQLAAAQAREQQLQKAMGIYFRVGPCDAWYAAIAEINEDFPADTSALEACIKQAGEVMRERCADGIGCVSPQVLLNYVQQARNSIRALPGVTMEDLG